MCLRTHTHTHTHTHTLSGPRVFTQWNSMHSYALVKSILLTTFRETWPSSLWTTSSASLWLGAPAVKCGKNGAIWFPSSRAWAAVLLRRPCLFYHGCCSHTETLSTAHFWAGGGRRGCCKGKWVSIPSEASSTHWVLVCVWIFFYTSQSAKG
jgi:hypothetical protein